MECYIITLKDKYWRGQAYNAVREQDNCLIALIVF